MLAVRRRGIPDRLREAEGGLLAHATVGDVGRTYLPGPLEQSLRVGRPPLGQRHLAQAGQRIGEERVIPAEHALERVEHGVHVGARFGAAAEGEQGLPPHQTRGADLV